MKKKRIEKQWFVLYVKRRQEFKVAACLENIGVRCFVPYITEVRQWSDRKKKIKVPLLPSMLLVFIEEKDIPKVFTVPGPVRFLFEHGKRAIVSGHEIAALEQYVSGNYASTKRMHAEETVFVPGLQQEATVIAVQGKKCIARLQQLEATVIFKVTS